ncbi:hypothetical protein D8805_04000 [Streptococcus oralis subsp. dentisani]|jgi:hypothetical protein|uniref:Uncharacterized protein n=1 Tax=Streptococcus oralis subsp. dentisani TaxID=1458253 RepID=A0A428G412_STROR|nr:hypothetical protein [Streptococcus oralis]RSJ69703.1 hypothetical protein D8805_04000 [Streptococcus oralis subsp. dentisani]
MKKLLKSLRELEWYYQLFIALISFVLLAFLIKFLIWIVPILLGLVILLAVATQGEIFFIPWQRYKQRNQTAVNPLFDNFYNWLTEVGVTELPISSLTFVQGVEVAEQGIYFVHINQEISDFLLEDFATKVRQVVKTLSNGSTDCVVSRSKREPFLAIKVRLVSADTMLVQKNQREEDF